jgi:hypothetical protein
VATRVALGWTANVRADFVFIDGILKFDDQGFGYFGIAFCFLSLLLV